MPQCNHTATYSTNPMLERVAQTPLVLASTYGTHDSVSHGSKKNLNTRSQHDENSASVKNSFWRFLGLHLDRGVMDNGATKEQIG